MGLSPQARGKPVPSDIRAPLTGPIPAGTGETGREDRWGASIRAYPRRHGGNEECGSIAMACEGLSPQARGKPPVPTPTRCDQGPIPAGTGETTSNERPDRYSGAYPRRHGGNEEMGVCGSAIRGLSPQARGKPSSMRFSRSCSGPIPAGTGETPP